ncbi:MAG: CocE/NonD family hydrolase C-terminal non-catalytic domain-containing protein [Planctomycetaceae bacterium]
MTKSLRRQPLRADPFKQGVRIFADGDWRRKEGRRGRLEPRRLLARRTGVATARAVPTRHYLAAGGRLSLDSPQSDSAKDGATSFTFDPHDPVPTIGGNISSGNGILLQGAWDQRGGPHVWNWTQPIPLSARNDVVVFQTEPLSGDIEVTGEIEVRLWISSTAADTDFTAKLIDVYPPSADLPGGFDLNIGDEFARQGSANRCRANS